MFKTRLKYLLMRSFDYTVKHWREDPEGLRAEVLADLERAAEYRKDLQEMDLMSFEIDELVYIYVSTPEIPSRRIPDGEVFYRTMRWASGVA